MSAISPDYLNRHTNNLRFFKTHDEAFCHRLTKVNYERVQLSIDPKDDRLNVIDQGVPQYDQCARLYAMKENEAFWQTCRDGEKVGWLPPPVQGDYHYPRYFHQHMERFLAQAPLKDKTQWTGYPIISPIPLLVVLGVGVGVHVQQCIEQKRCKVAVLYEPSLERFAVSLFVVDWLEIFRTAAQNGIAIHLTVGDGDNDAPSDELILNKLLSFKPYYPTATLVYNHLGSKWGEALVSVSKAHYFSHMSMLGNYDDEVNQLNQTIYHLMTGVKVFSQNIDLRDPCPVVIVGSGPSLDSNIEFIRSYRDNIILVSCGTALSVLHKVGLTPDYHVESESDQLKVALMDALHDDDYLSNICLLGPLQLSPEITPRFSDFYAYLRSESGIRDLIPSENNECLTLSGVTNCLTAAVVLFMELGFGRIYLCGADLAFSNTEEHHAKDSAYYDENANPVFKMESDYCKIPVFSVAGINGEPLLTEPRFLATKELLEKNIANRSSYPVKIYNLSSGVEIKHTQSVAASDVVLPEMVVTNSMRAAIKDTLEKGVILTDQQSITQSVETLTNDLKKFCDNVLLSRIDMCNSDDIYELVQKIPIWLNEQSTSYRKAVRCLLWGSLQHFLYAGYAQIMTQSEAEQEEVLAKIDGHLIHFISDITDHFESFLEDVMSGKYSSLLAKSIRDPE